MLQTIHQAAADVVAGRLTPLDLLDACLSRIERHEPRVKAWVLIERESARAEAERLATELRQGQRRGPLHGIPLGIKDIIDVFDWPTGVGSKRWAQSYARHDATVVRRLREAGAVLLGKTVTTPYASFDPPPTRNPWNPERTPGGSSSGSAAAVACGMALGTLGSQTGGSITRPASYCGVAACKPTFGRVSTHGVLPLAPSMDHVGPMGRCVRDVALLLETVAGADPLDPYCATRPVPQLTSLLKGKLAVPRLGRLRGLFDDRADPDMRAAIDRAAETLRKAGARVADVALPAGFGEVIARHRVVMAVEAAMYHEARLKRSPDDYGPAIGSLLEEGLRCPAPEYARCKEHQKRLSAEMAGCLEGLDALLMPATTGSAPPADTTGDPAFNSPWSYTGLPVVSFPVAAGPDRLPLCMQLVGPHWGEATLFQAAAWCEDALSFTLPEPPI
jgi:aspartyl-tRNA(Asn)/glutamyl-tRNA(Gln) amidotransferase subunit A